LRLLNARDLVAGERPLAETDEAKPSGEGEHGERDEETGLTQRRDLG
jgi:hypothetical protein